jgi:putative RNA 2'-phosphotransferase
MDYYKLSKIASYVLRHQPDEYGLTLDAEGWTNADEFLKAIHQKHPELKEASYDDLVRMTTFFDKQRHEVKDQKIRALYGHSVETPIVKSPTLPPEILYHATPSSNVTKILQDGLSKMNRQYVHLSTSIETARMVALRKEKNITVLIVHARDAFEAGVGFFAETEIWLSDDIPPHFIKST